MDYKGYKTLDKIILVFREARFNEWLPSAYLVDPDNEAQLKTARDWGTYKECGPYDRKTGEYEWTKLHKPTECEFDNEGFKLELLTSAGGSSQGGKLSFCNCKVSKDDKEFIIGINSDLLFDLLKNSTFVNGVCQDELCFITDKSRVGLTTKTSEIYKQAREDAARRDNFKLKQSTKYEFGNLVSTVTLNEIYLGELHRYYRVDLSYDNYFKVCWSKSKITILKKPEKLHIYKHIGSRGAGEEYKLSQTLLDVKEGRTLTVQERKQKRAVFEKIDFDTSQKEFNRQLLIATNCLEEYRNKDSWFESLSEDRKIIHFLRSELFGVGAEPFEFDENTLEKLTKLGIKFVKED